ncbi:MAG TPA: alpha/beta fold hydrolase [Candidatus Bathyarchaeia archaeon]|jgi:dienelactone hydrolase|nr:alpha/beta fold hydrolase [Candidatus Bathyarchaeia archaeon]
MKKPIPVAFKSKGANIHAIFYQASGVEPSPTAILCHGFPGNNLDVIGLGERLIKEEFSALAFNYRGTWGSEGLFTIANSLEDVTSAIRYLKSSFAVREFDVDASNITVIGYSYGGGMALLSSLTDPSIKRVVYIAGGSLSEVARMMKQSDEFKQAILKMVDQGISDSGFSSLPAEELFADVFADIDKYDLVKHAEALSNKDILIIGGWRDQENTVEHHILPLYRALQRHEAKQVQIEIFDTDHSFTNVSGQLADRIVSWLKRTPSKDKKAR